LWEKRCVRGLANTDPANLDREGYCELVGRYSGRWVEGRMDQFRQSLDHFFTERVDAADLDEWAAMGIEKEEDFADRYAARLFFGCEADDRANSLAFDTRLTPLGVRFKAIFGSDIGHFDVPDMRDVVAEAYELREHGLLDDADFRDFTFANAVRLHAGMNPRFFEGTTVEAEAAAVLAQDAARPAAARAGSPRRSA